MDREGEKEWLSNRESHDAMRRVVDLYDGRSVSERAIKIYWNILEYRRNRECRRYLSYYRHIMEKNISGNP